MVLTSCGPAKEETSKLKRQPQVELFTLTNKSGMEAVITNYGGIVVSLKAPDRNGRLADIVLGHDDLNGYMLKSPYFGAIVGRYGNRIAKGRFKLNGQEYTLAKNNGENALHGGLRGFDKVVWKAREAGPSALELTYNSADGEEGYPGNLTATVTYTLTDNNELRIDYLATTDKDTVLNLTNHSYFNLAGQGEGDILSHQVEIFADKFTPVDSGLIPTGELRPVEGTPFDFRKPMEIGARINGKDEQLVLGKGYDHNFVLTSGGGSLAPAARVYEAKSGRVMEVLTTEPAMQFYTGNFLDGSIKGKGGKVYNHRYGFCMETQHYPDSPNQPAFPSTVLKPGAKYQTTTVYKFSAK
jgi:aldose 1-epimerase